MQFCFPELNSLWDLQSWSPVHTASLHLEQGTGVPLSSLTPSAELSPPSQALVLDAARQPYNTWVSDSANAFCNPFAAHWVHFYSQCCFTVPNSQISSGSHSLPVMFAASWSLSALFARMRVAKGTDAQGAVVSLSRAQLFSVQVVRPWLHEQKNWICVLPDFFPAHLSRSRHVPWTCQSARCSSCQRDTFVLTPHLLRESTYSWDGSEGRCLICHKAWLFRVNPSEFFK